MNARNVCIWAANIPRRASDGVVFCASIIPLGINCGRAVRCKSVKHTSRAFVRASCISLRDIYICRWSLFIIRCDCTSRLVYLPPPSTLCSALIRRYSAQYVCTCEHAGNSVTIIFPCNPAPLERIPEEIDRVSSFVFYSSFYTFDIYQSRTSFFFSMERPGMCSSEWDEFPRDNPISERTCIRLLPLREREIFHGI